MGLVLLGNGGNGQLINLLPSLIMMDLICTNDGDVPLWMRIGSGNESDQKRFVQAMKDFKNQLKFNSLMVADSAI